MEASSKLLIKTLILIGHRKNYEIPFFPGVNIIYGEEDSGKSSILELINYLLGSSKLDKYIELEQSIQYAILELDLNDITYCIKRDIFDSKREVEVFISTYENMEKVFPTKYKPNYDNSRDAMFFSDFLLDALNFPKIKIKNSPTQDNSSLARLSFRDLFKFCYINQDNVGIKNFLNNQDYQRYHKTKEIFKYIFNLNDEESASLHQLISEKTSEKNRLTTKISNIKEFLATIEVESLDYITTFLEEIELNIKRIDQQILSLNNSITSGSENYEPLKEYLKSLNYMIENKEKERKNLIQNIKRYDKLVNDYYDDKLKFDSILSSKKLIGKVSPDITICPLCEHDIDQNQFMSMYTIHDTSKLTSEVNLLMKRIKDLKELSDKEKQAFRENEIELNKLTIGRDELRKSIDEELKEHISPYLAQRDEIVRQKSSLLEREQQIVKALKIRNEEHNLEKKIHKLEEDINNTKIKLDELLANQPQLENVLLDLKTILNAYLLFVGVKNCTDVDLNGKTFLPMLRNKQYQEITSGGIRTVMSIGFLLNILEFSLDKNTNLPRFLMIDTVGKYLQKTKNKYLIDTDQSEDIKEEINSASKYKNLYEYIINLSIKMEEANKSCQIILVDNDVPSFIEEQYKGFVVKKFSKDPNDHLPIGLIDDYSEEMY